MARKPRIEFAGALYHVIARGNQRRRVFLSSKDYEDYLERFWKYHNQFKFILHAYCLMPNHVHLLIETGDVPLSRIMQGIQFSYTQSFNRRHRKVGHLFQGRYKAILCQKDEYLLQLIRYLHLNPVRAKIVKQPKQYQWSSHRALLGLDKNPKCDATAIWKLFGSKRSAAIKRYEAFVLDAIGVGHRDDLYRIKDQRILGDEEFADELILAENKEQDVFFYEVSLPEIVEVVASTFGISKNSIYAHSRNRPGSWSRGAVAWLGKIISGISMRETGRYFKRSEAALAHGFRVIEGNLEKDSALKEKFSAIKKILTTNKAFRPRP